MKIDVSNAAKLHSNTTLPVIIENCSFTLSSPTLTAVMGPSGCGKSTLLKMLALLSTTSSGFIKFDDIEFGSNSSQLERSSFRRKNISFVPQTYPNVPHQTVKQNLIFGLTSREARTVAIQDRAKRVVESLGLNKILDKRSGSLSGGENQRLAIARALLPNKPIILLDEPSSALDANITETLMTLLREESSEGKIVLVSTHDPLVQTDCDAALYMAHGVLLEHR